MTLPATTLKTLVPQQHQTALWDFIISEIIPGIPENTPYQTEPDRKKAIQTAVRMAEKNDIILIAGKGHEKTQEIKGIKHPFSDLDVLLSLQ